MLENLALFLIGSLAFLFLIKRANSALKGENTCSNKGCSGCLEEFKSDK